MHCVLLGFLWFLWCFFSFVFFFFFFFLWEFEILPLHNMLPKNNEVISVTPPGIPIHSPYSIWTIFLDLELCCILTFILHKVFCWSLFISIPIWVLFISPAWTDEISVKPQWLQDSFFNDFRIELPAAVEKFKCKKKIIGLWLTSSLEPWSSKSPYLQHRAVRWQPRAKTRAVTRCLWPALYLPCYLCT